jgi:hypothetical protein
MEFRKQRTRFVLEPVGGRGEGKKKKSRHGPLLPDSIRAIICGPSNCGKTNLMVNLLFHRNGLRYQNCYIYSKSLHQPKYRHVKKVLRRVPEVTLKMFGAKDQVLPPEKTKPNSVIIFDDLACENQDVIRAYFSMGRHHGVDSFYLCQSYARIPKHLIRDNANLIFLFKSDDLNVKHVYEDHVRADMTLPQFHELCRAVWDADKYGYLVIDNDSPLEDGRYRRGLDEYLQT